MRTKRLWLTGLISGVLVIGVAAGAWAGTSLRKQITVDFKDIKITVDGKAVQSDAEPFLYVDQGRVYVPARPLAEAMGGTVAWDDATNTVKVYSKDYVESVSDGTHMVWTMPANGFSITTPANFVRQAIPTALLQVGAPNPDGTNTVIAVSQVPDLQVQPKELLNMMVESLKATFLPDIVITDTVEGTGHVTATGTASLGSGKMPLQITLRLVESEKGPWLLLSLVPQTYASNMSNALNAAFDSFQVQ